MLKVVPLKRGGTQILTEKFRCSQAYVSLALNYKEWSLKARLIRHYAVNKLGYIVIDNKKK